MIQYNTAGRILQHIGHHVTEAMLPEAPLIFNTHQDQVHLMFNSFFNNDRPRLAGLEQVAFRDKTHFFAIAATQMRRVLVDHARAVTTQKRGGGATRITLSENVAILENRTLDVLALDEALERLASVNRRHARVAALLLFAGLSFPEIAASIGVSERTVAGDWRVARARLARALRAEGGS